MRVTRRWPVGASAAVLLALGAGATSGALPGAGAVARSTAGSGMDWGPGMPSSADQMFAVQMTAHHESAVQMARLAVRRAQRPQVRALAADIERTQSAEIEQLRAAGVRLGSATAGPVPGPSGMGVRMAEMVQRQGSDPQIHTLAADMVRMQTSEIALMQGWLDQQ